MDSFQTAAGIIVLAWCVVWALLQLEHAWWRTLDFRVRYVMGMGTVCLGCVGAGIVLNDPALAIVPGVLATAGLPILKSYADEEKAKRAEDAAQRRGEVTGMARGIHKALSQESIDRGGPDGDDPSRN